ncbi:putative membrane protein [Catenuloplanes nepalensis]|uniref:Membrane protein n=1 Tax=Catenuloplanes nepalensis TaxID=587533 RepID=A0ABT9MNT2_9ACTN|nr:SRPBCC family protein [Catenuloplanes nepalensis]MDP9793039.1 putative membrane protein [Catenuloplanes nepalensis]
MRTAARTHRMLTLAAALTIGLAGAVSIGAPAEAAGRGVTCGGQGVDPNALIRYRSEVIIAAPLSTIWRLQTDVEGWPAWHAPVLTNERLDRGPLRAGSQFRWTTPAPGTTFTITSTVSHLRQQKCIRWSGPAVGEGLGIDEGIHVWSFTSTRDGVRVQTEETWTGDQVEADVEFAAEVLGDGLEQWLHDLETTAEAAAGQCPPNRRAR